MTLARLAAWMLYRLYRMGYKQMCLAFVCVCGFAGIFYYTVLQSASFSGTRTPYVSVNGVFSLTGLLSSISQQQLDVSSDEQKFHENQEESHHRKSFTHGLTNSNNNGDTDTIESLEMFTLPRPAKNKLFKHARHLDEKFLRNDERTIQRIVDGLDVYQSTQASEIFRKKGQLQKRFPTIIIVGVKKGGTRALLEMLKLHPQVCACGPEMHFFDRYYFKGLDWYRGKMPLCYENEASVEKTPSYFVTNGVEKDIFAYSKTLNHTLKLLVIVRDPTTRAISDFTQSQHKLWLNKKLPNRSFEQLALRVAADGSKSVDNQWGAIKIGVYSKHLKRWFRYFTPEQIHVVSGEALISKPYEEIKMVEKFLNLPSFIKREHFVYNDTKKFYCFDRSLSYNKSEVVTSALALRCLGTTKGRSHVKISKEMRRLLREYFRPFNKELYSMVGRNFGWQ